MNAIQITKLSESTIEDINEEHVGAWTTMITTSNPPIPNTHLSAYMDEAALQKRVIAFSNEKIKNVVGYKLEQPAFGQQSLKEVVDKWKAEGSWPNIENQ